jgi:hypothetical protein
MNVSSPNHVSANQDASDEFEKLAGHGWPWILFVERKRTGFGARELAPLR